MERSQASDPHLRESLRDTDGTEILLRDATEADRPRTRAIRWSAGWSEPPHQHRVWQEADEDLWVNHHYYREFVAEVGGVVAARVGLEAFRPPFAEICDLAVRPEFRRRGLGRHLTQKCLEEAARRDFVAIFLQTELTNNASHRLYQSLGFVPTAQGKMLRLVKFINYPLLADFLNTYPLTSYQCTNTPSASRTWRLSWNAYVTASHLHLTLEGGASQSDSEGVGPALTAFDWKEASTERHIVVEIESEERKDIEIGDYVELKIRAKNHGTRKESGIFKMLLPPDVRVSSPRANQNRVFEWSLEPGENLTQEVEIQMEPSFDSSPLWFLNYGSLPVCMETYWEGHRALLSTNLAMAIPPPRE